MEPEAEIEDGHLACKIADRRRSNSFNDDYSVQKTNDDATQCKYAAVQLNYWSDPFVKRFATITSGSGGVDHLTRRDPEISIGYFARVKCVERIVRAFLEKAGATAQIISLGCGFDTLYWRLREDGVSIAKYIEVDFSSVTAKKIRQIRKPGSPDVTKLFTGEVTESGHTDLHCGDYHLVGADVRQWAELEGKLQSTALDPNAPTLVLAECVLVYMSSDQSLALLSSLTQMLDTVVFVNYEQLNMTDKFGEVMVKNLAGRGIHLAGLAPCGDKHTQKERFSSAGFSSVAVYSMSEMYDQLISKHERSKAESIEHLDEMELLRQLLDHYCLCHAVADRGERWMNRLVLPEDLSTLAPVDGEKGKALPNAD